jgi:hypothetical protein
VTEPDVLAALRAYADAHDGWLACDFELADDGDELAEGFLRDEPLARSFDVFGHDKMLGLYARWRSDEAPVVYLAADWDETGVLCDDLEDFVALLTLGRDRIGMLGDWDADQEPCEGIDEFRGWAERELGIEPATAEDARAMVERARAAHPDLKAWIEDRRR